MYNFICKYCNKEFEFDSKNKFGGHTTNCKENPNRKEYFKKIGDSLKKRSKELGYQGTKKVYKLNCKKCDKVYEIFITENLYNKNKYTKHCSNSCANSHIRTEASKAKSSNSAINSKKVQYANNPANWNDPRNMGKYIRKIKVRPIDKCLHCTKDIIRRGNKERKYHKECWLQLSGGLKENSTRLHRKIYKGIKLDSGLEEKFVILLDKFNIGWVKNNTIFYNYIGKDGKSRKFYPDFYLEEFGQWVETKGKFMGIGDIHLEEKRNSIENLIVLFDKDVRQIKTIEDLYRKLNIGMG